MTVESCCRLGLASGSMATRVLLYLSVVAVLWVKDCSLSTVEPNIAQQQHGSQGDVRLTLDHRNDGLGVDMRTMAEKRLFHFLGQKAPETTTRKALKPPKYMLDFYHAMVDDQGRSRRPGLLDVDIVRSIPDIDTRGPKFYKFDLSAITGQEIVLDAELHLFQSWKKFNKAFSRQRRPSTTYFVKVYQILAENAAAPESNPIKKLISARRLRPGHGGWHIFSMHRTVEEWLYNAEDNHGLEIELTTRYGQPIENTYERESPRPSLVVFTRNPDAKEANKEENGTERNGPSENMNSRNRRSAETPGEKSRRMIAENRAKMKNDKNENKGFAHEVQEGGGIYLVDVNTSGGADSLSSSTNEKSPHPTEPSAPVSVSKGSGRHGTCQRYHFEVDFEELGWSWMIIPRKYTAYRCHGSCNNMEHVDNNYARMQIVVYGSYNSQCCVPHEYRSLSVLYFDNYENLVYSEVPDMVVASCRCQ